MKFYSIILFFFATLSTVSGVLILSGKLKEFSDRFKGKSRERKAAYFIAVGLIFALCGIVSLNHFFNTLIFISLMSLALNSFRISPK